MVRYRDVYPYDHSRVPLVEVAMPQNHFFPSSKVWLIFQGGDKLTQWPYKNGCRWSTQTTSMHRYSQSVLSTGHIYSPRDLFRWVHYLWLSNNSSFPSMELALYSLCDRFQATTGHFWSMVWQQQSRAVIMLNRSVPCHHYPTAERHWYFLQFCRVIEKGTLKCHQYWPASAGETVTCEAVELSITNINFVPGDHYNVSTLRSVQDNYKVGPQMTIWLG